MLAVLGWIFQSSLTLPDQQFYLCIPAVLALECLWRQQTKPREFAKCEILAWLDLSLWSMGWCSYILTRHQSVWFKNTWRVGGFSFFLSHFSCKPLQGSNIHHFPLFLPALNDKPQQMAVTDIQPEFQLQTRCSSGNPQAWILFSACWGEQGAAQGHPALKEPQLTPRHLQMCTMTGTLCRTHSLYKWIISSCKSAGAQSTAPPQMPKCDLATWFLEKADAGRRGEVLRISGDMNSCTKMGEILFSWPSCENQSPNIWQYSWKIYY